MAALTVEELAQPLELGVAAVELLHERSHVHVHPIQLQRRFLERGLQLRDLLLLLVGTPGRL